MRPFGRIISMIFSERKTSEMKDIPEWIRSAESYKTHNFAQSRAGSKIMGKDLTYKNSQSVPVVDEVMLL